MEITPVFGIGIRGSNPRMQAVASVATRWPPLGRVTLWTMPHGVIRLIARPVVVDHETRERNPYNTLRGLAELANNKTAVCVYGGMADPVASKAISERRVQVQVLLDAPPEDEGL